MLKRYYSSMTTLSLGIDLGTTNTLASYIPSGSKTPKILSQTKIPSVVSYVHDKSNLSSNFSKLENERRVTVGTKAINLSRLNPQNTFKATKRIIGTSNPHAEAFLAFLNQYPYHSHIENTIKFDIEENKEIGAVEVAGEILNEVRIQALSELGLKNTIKKTKNSTQEETRSVSENLENSVNIEAVITVPAYFNNLQRQATLKAASLAHINCLRIINEPTAAALSFGVLQQQKNRDGIFAVYDLGGGTFDVSILELDGSVFEVRGTSGDLQLGGEDLDYLLRDFAIKKFSNGDRILKKDMISNENFMNELLKSCENCKIELSRQSSTFIAIPFAFRNSKTGEMVNFKINVEESELDTLAEPMVKKTLKLFKRCLKEAKVDKNDIKQVLLVGGMTRMPYIRNLLSENFANNSFTLLNSSINPDDSVCLGASIQAGLLKGEIKDVLLLDVNPLTLGMETYGGIMSPMLAKNCSVPIEVKEQFSTGIDNQQIVKIVVYQGESNLCRDNVKLGEFLLSGIPQLPKGVPKIEVAFKLDSNGILNVSAKEVLTGLVCELELVTTAPIEKELDENKSNVDASELKWVFENLGLWKLSFMEVELQMRQYSNYVDESLVGQVEDLKKQFGLWEEYKNDSIKDEYMINYFVKENGMDLLKKKVNKLQNDFMEQLKGKKL